MYFLNTLLGITFLVCLLFNYLAFISKNTAFQIVKEMGIGYNLGGIFDCYNNSEIISNPNNQKTLCGNIIPTKEMIKSIKKYGFKTIVFP